MMEYRPEGPWGPLSELNMSDYHDDFQTELRDQGLVLIRCDWDMSFFNKEESTEEIEDLDDGSSCQKSEKGDQSESGDISNQV